VRHRREGLDRRKLGRDFLRKVRVRVRTSKRPTAQALLPASMSEMSSIISLLLVMLWR
jgi:hypothetical protein